MHHALAKSLAVACIAALVACGQDTAPAAATERTERTLPVQAVEIAPRDLSRTVRVSAPVAPLRTIRLAARTDGIVTEVLVEEGDAVEEDQVLARIDTAEQRAESARARARLAERRANFSRLERLRDSGHIDAAAFEEARAELAVAESEAQLWDTRVSFGDVRASAAGTVIVRNVEPGEAVSRQEPLFEIADLATLVIRVGVSELDVRDLSPASPVTVTVDAVAGNAMRGVVRRVFPAADPASRLVTVEIELPDATARGIRPGFLARATLEVDRRPEALAVPAGAVAEADGANYVMVITADDRLERRVVETGVTRGGWQEIRAGLAPGENVVATNPLDLNEGTRVRIVGWAG